VGAALANRLDGEHAAVYAYGVVVATAARDRVGRARDRWQAHVLARDALDRQLRSMGVTPPAAAAAYDVGERPHDAEGAARLAARVEDGVCLLAAYTVGVFEGDLRRSAATALVAAAREAASWDADAPAFPGDARSVPSSTTGTT
jgi:hypothetical protein